MFLRRSPASGSGIVAGLAGPPPDPGQSLLSRRSGASSRSLPGELSWGRGLRRRLVSPRPAQGVGVGGGEEGGGPGPSGPPRGGVDQLEAFPSSSWRGSTSGPAGCPRGLSRGVRGLQACQWRESSAIGCQSRWLSTCRCVASQQLARGRGPNHVDVRPRVTHVSRPQSGLWDPRGRATVCSG
jgi:hypothetical protein